MAANSATKTAVAKTPASNRRDRRDQRDQEEKWKRLVGNPVRFPAAISGRTFTAPSLGLGLSRPMTPRTSVGLSSLSHRPANAKWHVEKRWKYAPSRYASDRGSDVVLRGCR